jgi:hypothetical protein
MRSAELCFQGADRNTYMTMNPSDWISLLALAVSAFAAWKTITYGRSQHDLNQLLLREKEAVAEDAKKAKLVATLHGNRVLPFRVEIANEGTGTARNIRIEFEAEHPNQILPKSEISRKFPHSRLLPGSSLLLKAIEPSAYVGHSFVLSWNDDSMNGRSQAIAVVRPKPPRA